MGAVEPEKHQAVDYGRGPARWINTALLVVLAWIALDVLLLWVREDSRNIIVRLVRAVAGLFLAPFEGILADQPALLTSVIAALVYFLIACIVLAVLHRRQLGSGGGSALKGDSATTSPEAEH